MDFSVTSLIAVPPQTIFTWWWFSWSCFTGRRRGSWHCALGRFWADSTTRWTAIWRGGNIREELMECGSIPRWRTLLQMQDCRRWRPTSTAARTHSHILLRPGPLFTCTWRRIGGLDKDGQVVVGARRTRFGGDTDSGFGGRMNREGGGDVWDGYGDRLSQWENNISHATLETYPNATIACATIFETHHLIMSAIGEHRGRLEREIDSHADRHFLSL